MQNRLSKARARGCSRVSMRLSYRLRTSEGAPRIDPIHILLIPVDFEYGMIEMFRTVASDRMMRA